MPTPRVIAARPRRACVVVAFLGFAACDPMEPPALEQDERQIVGGLPDPNDDAVVMLQTPGGGCTGLLVSRKVILTAAHCVSRAVELDLTDSGYVSFGGGDDNGDYFAYASVADMVMYRLYQPPAFQQYDIAMMRLDEAAPDAVLEVPINFEPLTEAQVGRALRTVGFGLNDGVEGTGFGTKRQANFSLDELTRFHIGLGSADVNICQGDSGGPTFATFDGEERVVGVSSFGSEECRNRSYVSRTDIYEDWITVVMDAWDGPCEADGTCKTDGCRTPDPDCDVCGFDGVCGIDCAQPDLDCPLGIRAGEPCDDAFDCEGRVCLEAPDAAGVRYCSESCDPALGGTACTPPLGACVEDAGAMVCAFNGATPGIQGDDCDDDGDCRIGSCDPDDDICVASCDAAEDTCGDGFVCSALGDGMACRRVSEDGGCGCSGSGSGAGVAAALLALGAAALASRRRRRGRSTAARSS